MEYSRYAPTMPETQQMLIDRYIQETQGSSGTQAKKKKNQNVCCLYQRLYWELQVDYDRQNSFVITCDLIRNMDNIICFNEALKKM